MIRQVKSLRDSVFHVIEYVLRVDKATLLLVTQRLFSSRWR